MVPQVMSRAIREIASELACEDAWLQTTANGSSRRDGEQAFPSVAVTKAVLLLAVSFWGRDAMGECSAERAAIRRDEFVIRFSA